jgi:hypothetical protein
MNFLLLYTFKVRSIVFFGKIFVLNGRFGFPIFFFKILSWACKFRRLAPKRIFGSFSLEVLKIFFWKNVHSDWLIWCFNNFLRILGRSCKFRKVAYKRIFDSFSFLRYLTYYFGKSSVLIGRFGVPIIFFRILGWVVHWDVSTRSP